MFALPKDRDVVLDLLEYKTIDAFENARDGDLYLWKNLGKKTGLKFRRQLYKEITEE